MKAWKMEMGRESFADDVHYEAVPCEDRCESDVTLWDDGVLVGDYYMLNFEMNYIFIGGYVQILLVSLCVLPSAGSR